MRDTSDPASTRRKSRKAAPRVSWARLLPLLLAYGLVLALSPVGQAGHLWVHLATGHHEAVDEHHAEDDHHEHRDDAPPAPDAPHEHDGVVHTHDQAPVEDPTVPADGLSKYYLLPTVAHAPPPARDASVGPSPEAVPRQAAFRIDTPPPRLQG
ncbi:MAG TPA: hypothetical protein VF263_07725 [Longimicrobiaceae bacterium]